jgi:YbbR domain-containing protein
MKAKGFWARAVSDWPAKVLSLAAALLLFFFYRLNRLEERFLSVPLTVVTNAEYVPGSQYPRSVRLSLRGESNELFQIQEEDIKASVDLSGVRAAGLAKATITIEKRGAALGMDPLEINADPAELSVTMERKASRVVPVTPAFRGYLDPGWNLKSFDIAPGEVEISGPESAVARVEDVGTEPIELSGKQADFTVKSKLVRANPLVTVSGTDSVEFRGYVEKAVALKSFSSVAIAALNLADWLALEEPMPAARLNVKSADGAIHSFELAPGAVSVDFSSVRKTGSYTLPVTVNLPAGLTLDSLEPAAVTVRVVQRQGATE